MTTTHDIPDALLEVGRRAWQRGWVAGNDGNFSYRLDEETILATPTMVSKGFMRREDLVLIDTHGEPLPHQPLGSTRRTTTEIRLHLNAYHHRPDIRAVYHVHPPHATAFAISSIPMPKGVLEEFELVLGEIPLIPYRPTGSWEFARGLDPWITTHSAFLLANHGAVTFGVDPFDAYYRMEVLDHTCRILLLAQQLGGWQRMGVEKLRALLAVKAATNLSDPRVGQTDEELMDDHHMTTGHAQSVSFTGAKWDGKTWPLVTDEPKKG
jgi:L-fuculose-phosphate aldolase